MSDDSLKQVVNLTFDYLRSSLAPDSTEDPDETKSIIEEKYNRLYDAVWDALGFPSFAESQQQLMEAKITLADSLNQSHEQHTLVSQKLTKMIATCTKLMLQQMDLPAEEKSQLLAEIDPATENIQLHCELKTAVAHFEILNTID